MPRDSQAADSPDPTPAGASSGSRFGTVALLAIIGAALFTLWFRTNLPRDQRPLSAILDIPAPPLVAQGWINGPEPTQEELAGKVVVIEAWATWCGPCWRRAPEFVRLYERYRDQGVVFIGLTTDTERDLDAVHEFINENKIPWPNGYGADQTLIALGNEAIPAAWVIAPNGQIIWRSETSDGSLEAAINYALDMKAAPPAESPPADAT